jgi:hypothetical protein
MAQGANVSAPTRRIIADDLIRARQGGAWLVNRGQHIRVIEVENVRRKYHGMAETFSVGGPLGIPPFGCCEVPQKARRCAI